jgi:hypothetical protein
MGDEYLFGIFRRRRADELALIDAEITSFGEALAGHSLALEEHAADADLLADYTRALDAYDQAKAAFVGDRNRKDATDVLCALDEGRYALACVDARLAGLPTPPRRPLCFFDPRHGPSTDRVPWTPEAGATRIIDVCAADAIRLAEGMSPIATGGSRPPVPRPESIAPRGGARTSQRPSQGPEPSPQSSHRGPRAFKLCPPNVHESRRAEGQGDTDLKFPSHTPGVPAVLVVRSYGGSRTKVELFERGSARILHQRRNHHRSRVVEPIPVRKEQYVRVRVSSSKWAAWIQPADTVPVVYDHVASRGSFIFHYAGGPAHIKMTHTDRGDFSLTELTPDFEQGSGVLSGKGDTYAEGHLSGPTYLHVRAAGTWKITIA